MNERIDDSGCRGCAAANNASGTPPAGERSRREFLRAAAAGGTTVLSLRDIFGSTARAEQADQQTVATPLQRQRVGSLQELRTGAVVDFVLEPAPRHGSGAIYKLGAIAGGGVGPEKDVVAFSTVCTHMGDSLTGMYSAEHSVAGPCPSHLTTFDLTRHGIVAAGHASQPLPQFVLELDQDGHIYVTAVSGLLYGHYTNPIRPRT